MDAKNDKMLKIKVLNNNFFGYKDYDFKNTHSEIVKLKISETSYIGHRNKAESYSVLDNLPEYILKDLLFKIKKEKGNYIFCPKDDNIKTNNYFVLTQSMNPQSKYRLKVGDVFKMSTISLKLRKIHIEMKENESNLSSSIYETRNNKCNFIMNGETRYSNFIEPFENPGRVQYRIRKNSAKNIKVKKINDENTCDNMQNNNNNEMIQVISNCKSNIKQTVPNLNKIKLAKYQTLSHIHHRKKICRICLSNDEYKEPLFMTQRNAVDCKVILEQSNDLKINYSKSNNNIIPKKYNIKVNKNKNKNDTQSEASINDPDFVFISPCNCKGESKFVHLSCLKRWLTCGLEHKTLENSRFILYHYKKECEICKGKIPDIVKENDKIYDICLRPNIPYKNYLEFEFMDKKHKTIIIANIKDKRFITIGRTPDNDLPFNNSKIEKKHAIIELDDDNNLYLWDNNTRCGTSVLIQNDIKINDKEILCVQNEDTVIKLYFQKDSSFNCCCDSSKERNSNYYQQNNKTFSYNEIFSFKEDNYEPSEESYSTSKHSTENINNKEEIFKKVESAFSSPEKQKNIKLRNTNKEKKVRIDTEEVNLNESGEDSISEIKEKIEKISKTSKCLSSHKKTSEYLKHKKFIYEPRKFVFDENYKKKTYTNILTCNLDARTSIDEEPINKIRIYDYKVNKDTQSLKVIRKSFNTFNEKQIKVSTRSDIKPPECEEEILFFS